jgi:hypothetical protein
MAPAAPAAAAPAAPQPAAPPATAPQQAAVPPPAPPPVAAAAQQPDIVPESGALPRLTAADITSCPTTVSRTDVAQLSETLQRSGSSVKTLLNLLTLCEAEVKTLIADSQFGYVYQPTMFSKDVALALETHLNEIPESRRVAATSAIKRVVLAAWLLDAYGDMGNKDRLTGAYNQFAAAVADVKAAYGSPK